MASLRIVFPKPGFFLADARLLLAVDGRPAYDGSFKEGVDVTLDVGPGGHRLESRIEMGALARTKQWDIEVGDAPVVAELAYSRFWGNFKKSLVIR